ncbi:MAG: hypothetical protein ACR2LI_12680 [Propionibacteriaceae bacterium]
MFEYGEVGSVSSESVSGRAGVLAASVANRAARLRVEAQKVVLAADWADLHAAGCLPAAGDRWEERRRRLAAEHPVRFGGVGTPEVLACAPAELAVVTHSSFGATRALIADALDLRHRLPRIWALLSADGVEAWQARRIAVATRSLTGDQAGLVDAQLAGLVGRLSWGRLETVVEAAVAAADPVGAAAAELAAAQARFVGIGSRTDHHIVTLVARIEALDGLCLMALVNRLADVLAVEGDSDPVEVRRATALGLLARPDQVLRLLRRHAGDRPHPPHDPRHDVPQPDHAPPDHAQPDHEPAPAEPAPDEPDPDEPAGFLPDGALSDGVLPDDVVPDDGPPDDPNGLEVAVSAPAPEHESTESGSGSVAFPKVVLHVHLSDAALRGAGEAIARVEGVGPITVATVRDWLGRADVAVSVRPVPVAADAVPADSYEIPDRLRRALRLRHPAEIYPWGTSTDGRVDLDHTIPYRSPERGGPPGQTSLDNLGPLTRRHHRLKTHGQLAVRQPAAGVYLWRTTHGYTYLVTNTGTWDLGHGTTATALWHAAAPTQTTPPTTSDVA